MSQIAVLEPEVAPAVVLDDSGYEVVNDIRVELPPMAANAVRIAFKLGCRLEVFAEANDLGQAATEMLFRLRAKPKLHRRPDVAFISFGRWAKETPITEENAWEVIPDLVVEVVSPTNLGEEILLKIQEYFEAGVRLAWLIFPQQSLVYEYQSVRSVRILGAEDTLDGGDVLPGFRLPLTELFTPR